MDETYARIVANLPSEYLPVATRLLQFLSYSERPLSLEEAVDCIAVDTSAQRFDPDDRIPVPEEISRYCSSLVVIVKRIRTIDEAEAVKTVTEIRLAHYSVKEYLVSNRLPPKMSRDLDMKRARETIANVCLTYMLRKPNGTADQRLYPLARYAAQYWTSHAMAANTSQSLVKLIVEFFNCRKAFEACYQLYPIDLPWRDEDEKLNTPPALYYAAFAGLSQVVQAILDNGTNANSQGGECGNALQAASFEGHENIVKLLLHNGASVNLQGGEYNSALQAASFEGHENIVKLLLSHGANINAQGGFHGNALQAASIRGHENIVRLLLNNSADVNLQGGAYRNALQAASYYGHGNIIQILLDNGANIDVQGGKHGNALQAAANKGHENVVQLLLENGANVNTWGGVYENALQAASQQGHENIVRILLKHGVDRSLYNGALQASVKKGHLTITRMLEDAISASTHAQPIEDSCASTDLTIRKSYDIAKPVQSNKRSIEPESTIEPPQKRARIPDR